MPEPPLLWQAAHWLVTLTRALCLAWLPARFGAAAPFGGLLWQDVQFLTVRGDPAVWQVEQARPTPPPSVAPWQSTQAAAMLPAD